MMLDGEVPPPWIVCPDLSRYSIGWRMGDGEDVMAQWWQHEKTLGRGAEPRLDYLQRYGPAPLPWADFIHEFLFGRDEGKHDVSRLRALGLVASDVAHSHWLQDPRSRDWAPWLAGLDLEAAARYAVRSFWFWSRQSWRPESLPDDWTALHQPKDLSRGLLALAQMFWTGEVKAPWALGLSVNDFKDSYDATMGYVDAFRWWCLEAIDDVEQLTALLGPVPEEWHSWLATHGPSA